MTTLYEPTEEEVHSGALGKQLRQFNYAHIGEYAQTQYLRLNAKDADGQLLGGIRSLIHMEWLYVELLWVAESARGTGLGSRLLTQTEDQSRGLGACNAQLNTFDWQAEGFYVKHGYGVFARIDNYFRGRELVMMKKTL